MIGMLFKVGAGVDAVASDFSLLRCINAANKKLGRGGFSGHGTNEPDLGLARLRDVTGLMDRPQASAVSAGETILVFIPRERPELR